MSLMTLVLSLCIAHNTYPPQSSKSNPTWNNNSTKRKIKSKYSQVFASNHTVTSLVLRIWTWMSRKHDDDETTWEEKPRRPILDLLARAGVSVDLSVVQHLPTWQQHVVDGLVYGDCHPRRVGTVCRRSRGHCSCPRTVCLLASGRMRSQSICNTQYPD